MFRKEISLSITLILLSCFFVGCGNNTKTEENPITNEVVINNTEETTTDDVLEQTEVVVEKEPEFYEYESTMNNAATKLIGANAFDDSFIRYVDAKNDNKNYMVSPMSLKAALGLLTCGSDGETLDELLSVGFQNKEEYLAWMNSIRAAEFKTKDSTFLLSYSLWHNSDKPGQFNKSYKSMFKALDVTFESEKGSKLQNSVNQWVDKETNGLIPSLFDRPLADTTNLLLNTAYLKDNWLSPFKGVPYSSDFVDINKNVTTKEFISQTEYFNYYEDNDSQIVILPLKNGIKMAFVLGDDTGFSNKIKKSTSRYVNVTIPKFETETYVEDVVGYLKSIGIETAFSEEADFFVMMNTPTYVGDILQKTKITVNEDGVEASAASAVVMLENAIAESPQQPVYFNANVPFSYFVYTEATGSTEVIFYGQYVQ